MAMNRPLVSIVVTTYNRAEYIKTALDTILAQTYGEWELIIYDDGSTDDSRAIIADYTAKDVRIRCVFAHHKGRAASLRSAIGMTRGKYLGWVDSDDWIDLECLSKTVAVLEREPSAGMVYTDHFITNESGKILKIADKCKIPYCKDRLLVDFMTFNFRLIRREVYDLVGGISLEFPQAQDYDICLKISEVTEIEHLTEPLYFYRVHADSISQGQKDKQIERSFKAVQNAIKRRALNCTLELTTENRFRLS
jgi:glycosyltransferase involved in cell wall biosynthesis